MMDLLGLKPKVLLASASVKEDVEKEVVAAEEEKLSCEEKGVDVLVQAEEDID